MKDHCIIVMGVSGSGKSFIGKKLAGKLKGHFIEGDDLHPEVNVKKMERGQPLTDSDRIPWLELIVAEAVKCLQSGRICVVACSALKKAYRDKLREAGPVTFVYLHGDFELMLKRMTKRKGHFMPQSLLQSQFDALEEPGPEEKDAITVDNAPEAEKVVQNALHMLEKKF